MSQGLDTQLLAELEVVSVLHRLSEQLGGDSRTAVQRVTLTTTNASDNHYRGNPANWELWRARTVAVWNNNPFVVYVGHGTNSGQPGMRTVVVPPYTLAVLPLESEVYSIGTDAANLGANDYDVTLWRFEQALPPVAYELAVDGTAPLASGLDDSSYPVKVGGVYHSALPTPADGTRVDAQMGSRGALRVELFGASQAAGAIVTAPGDAAAGTLGLNSLAQNLLYNGATWDRQRTPTIFKVLNAVAIGTEVAVWTPTAGKRFRMMGWGLRLDTAAALVYFRDNTAGTIIRVAAGAVGAWITNPPGEGNGTPSAAANNVLTLQATAANNVSGYIFGTEE